MHIVQIVPNWNVFSPTTAVGIRGVVKDLCLGLQEKGHKVTLIAPRGSQFPNITIKETTLNTASLGLSSRDYPSWAYRIAHAAQAVSLLNSADIVHSHLEHILLPFTPFIKLPLVHTLHSIDYRQEDKFLFREFPKGYFVALSQRHKELVSVFVNIDSVCYNGIDTQLYSMDTKSEDYLLWIGRYVPEKGADVALEIAQRTEKHTILAGFFNKTHASYYESLKKQEIPGKIEVFGESLGEEKIKLYQNATALINPIHWEEPFGLTMVEAMACGTPVIAYNRGSVSEIVRDGVTGFIIDPDDGEGVVKKRSWVIKKQGVEGLIEAVGRIGEIDRAGCREHVEQHFSIGKMVERYENIYTKAIESYKNK